MIRTVLLAAACLVAAPAWAGDLVVKVTGLKDKGGTIRVALYGHDPLYRDAVAAGEAAAKGDTVTVTIHDLAAGDYVVSAFHDADNDGRLGFANGRLSEGTAISNAEQLRGAPSFAVNKVPVPADGATVTIRMSYPEDRKGW